MRTSPNAAPFAALLALSVLVIGCNNEPEETPNLEDVIPLDNPDDVSADVADGETNSDSDQSVGSNGEEDARGSVSDADGDRSATMQSGSNADGARAADPTRTKLLPAD